MTTLLLAQLCDTDAWESSHDTDDLFMKRTSIYMFHILASLLPEREMAAHHKSCHENWNIRGSIAAITEPMCSSVLLFMAWYMPVLHLRLYSRMLTSSRPLAICEGLPSSCPCMNVHVPSNHCTLERIPIQGVWTMHLVLSSLNCHHYCLCGYTIH